MMLGAGERESEDEVNSELKTRLGLGLARWGGWRGCTQTKMRMHTEDILSVVTQILRLRAKMVACSEYGQFKSTNLIYDHEQYYQHTERFFTKIIY